MSNGTDANAPRRRNRLRDSWRRLSEGLTLQELWSQFRNEAGVSYRLYSSDLEKSYKDEPRRRRWFRMAGALFWALLLKLSPPRRIFLLLALIMLVGGLQSDHRGWALVGSLALLALLGLELADRVAMKRDLELAREIQKWLVPQSPPSVAGVDIAFMTRAANTVAGDYYDAFLYPLAAAGEGPSQRLLIVVADVAGKSMPAALLMATFHSSLRTLVQEAMPLAGLVSRLNRYSCQHSLEGRRFTTTVIAELDPATGALSFVNAGHNPPALRRTNGTLEWLKAGGLPLGIRDGESYESGAVTLHAGDLLVVFTDGVVEAQNERGEEYGESRLAELLRPLSGTSADDVLQRLMSSVESFNGNAGRQDDITCLVLRYTGV